MFRALCVFLTAGFLAGCTTELDTATQDSGIGDFRLDRLVIIADDATQGPVSRPIEDEKLEIAMTKAMEERFGRFQGDNTYSFGIKVHGYVLSGAAIPVLFAPRSMLLMTINVYDDVPKRINPEPRKLTVFEDAGGDTVVGSGYTQTADEQLAELSENAAIEIERWLRENERWFNGPRARPESNPQPLPTEEDAIDPDA